MHRDEGGLVMKRITKAVLAALSALFFASCVKVYPADDWRIEEYYVMTLVNKSAREVAWFVPKHGDVPCEEAGALPELFGDDERNSLMFTGAGQRYYVSIIRGAENSPLEGYHIDDTVPFYVFDTAVLRDSSWEAIKRDSLWLACYEMSVEAVVANDYQLCYTD